MKKLPFSLEGFTKVDANRDHTVFQHNSDGHLIYIANKSLQKDFHEALRKLPIQKMNQGGVVKKDPYQAAGKTIASTGSDKDKANIAKAFKMNDGGVVGRHGQPLKMSGEGIKSPAEQIVPEASPEDIARVKASMAADSAISTMPIAQADATKQPQIIPGYNAPLINLPSLPVLSPEQKANFGFSVAKQEAPDSLPAQEPTAPQNFQLTPAEAPRGLAEAPPTPQQPNVLQTALGDYRQGAQNLAKAEGAVAKEQEGILTQHIAQQADVNKLFNDNLVKMQQANEMWQQKLLAKEVDPNRFMNSKSTLGKILTGVGLMIGGAPAAEFVNKQIEQDINAQKADLDNQNTLYAQNMKVFGNVQDALQATRIQMNGMVEAQLKAAALKQASPQAIAKAQMGAAEFAAKNAEEMNKFAQGQAARQAAQQMLGKSGPGADPYQAQVRAMELIDPKRAEDLRSRLVPGAGFANTMEQAKELSNLRTDSQTARDNIKRLQEISRVPFKSLDLGLRREAKSLVTLLTASLNKPVTGGGPLQSTERELLNQLSANPTAIFSLDSVNRKALDTLLSYVNRREDNALKHHGLEVKPRASGPTPQGLK